MYLINHSQFTIHHSPFKLPLLAVLLLLLSATACASPTNTTPPAPPPTADPAPVHLWIGVADDALPLAQQLVDAYPLDDGRPVFHLVPGNGRALRTDLTTDYLDAALLYHLPPTTDLWYTPIALDGLVPVAGPAAPADLTRPELQAVFSGQVENWAAVGGADAPITVHIREPGHGLRLLLAEQVMVDRPVAVQATTHTGSQELLAAVATEAGAVGYVGVGMTGNLSETVQAIMVEGRPATANTLGTQQYLLTTPVYAAAAVEPAGPLRRWLSWVQSPAGQAVAAEIGYGRVR